MSVTNELQYHDDVMNYGIKHEIYCFARKCTEIGWSRWPRSLRRGFAAARVLGMRVRIPPATWLSVFLISNFRRVLNLVCTLFSISPASDCGFPTFRNPLSIPSSRAGCKV